MLLIYTALMNFIYYVCGHDIIHLAHKIHSQETLVNLLSVQMMKHRIDDNIKCWEYLMEFVYRNLHCGVITHKHTNINFLPWAVHRKKGIIICGASVAVITINKYVHNSMFLQSSLMHFIRTILDSPLSSAICVERKIVSFICIHSTVIW